MKMLFRWRVLAAALALTAAVSGLLVPGTAHAEWSNGSVTIDVGDNPSGGTSWSYSSSKGDRIAAYLGPVGPRGTTVIITIDDADRTDLWRLSFDAPGRRALARGTYTGVARYPENKDSPGLEVGGRWSSCSVVTGSFTIINAAFGPSRDYVQTFDATFDQHCDGQEPPVRGEVHISNPPATGSPQPRTLATGSFSFGGPPGDFVSQGDSYSYSTSKGDGLDAVVLGHNTVSITVTGYYGDHWSLDLEPRRGQTLAPGTYTVERIVRSGGVSNQDGPDMNVSGLGRGCNEMTGSFTITHAEFGPNRLVRRLDARFEQHCEAVEPAARGEVHISKRPLGGMPWPVTGGSASDDTIRTTYLLTGVGTIAWVVLLAVGFAVGLHRRPRRP